MGSKRNRRTWRRENVINIDLGGQVMKVVQKKLLKFSDAIA
jgi:hypothetical protein